MLSLPPFPDLLFDLLGKEDEDSIDDDDDNEDADEEEECSYDLEEFETCNAESLHDKASLSAG